MLPNEALASVAHVIQTALTPVFLLSGIGTLLNVFNQRLSRVADQYEHISELLDKTTDPDKVAIVRAILSLAQALGLATVAEGVETPELAQRLAGMGCTWGQGYTFARPLDEDEAYRLIVARNG